MTTDSMSKVDWSRMSPATKARKLGYHPTEFVNGAGVAYAYSAQPMQAEQAEPKADDGPSQVVAAVAAIGNVPAADLCTAEAHTKRDPQTCLARCALVKALRRRMSLRAACDAIDMHTTTGSLLSRKSDALADSIAERALARVEG
ncbi:MAG: hypothetical protein U5L06_00825 [Rhodovibrio sp.]|nr:hypothetical protein [Rhodovibrio sp.]